jgi:hypothetical protein
LGSLSSIVAQCPFSASFNFTFVREKSPVGHHPAMASMTFTMPTAGRLGAPNVLRAVPVRVTRATRLAGMRVAAAVKFDYDTKVFKKELVKFADTEEFIYRCAFMPNEALQFRLRVETTTTA